MKTNVCTIGIFLLSRDEPQTDRQTDKKQNHIIQKPSKPLQNSITQRVRLKARTSFIYDFHKKKIDLKAK